LCVFSNDPNEPLKLLPVQMTVAYPPVIADQSFSVAENSPTGTVVGTVKASDPDPGDNQTFALEAGNEDGVFSLNTTNGQLTIVDGSKLDYESKSSYVLDVKVTDKYGLTDSAKVTVNVTNVAELKALVLTTQPAKVMVGDTISVTATISDDMGGPVVGQPVLFTDGVFTANLSGANEVPANSSTGIATGTFALDPVALTISYKLDVTGVISVTGAHIHAGGPGVNGAVVFPLDTTTWMGTVPVTAEQVAQMIPMLLTGQFYVNIHTADYPGGEIRGQLSGSMMAVTDANGQATISYTGTRWGPVKLFAVSGTLSDDITVVFETYNVYLSDIFKGE